MASSLDEFPFPSALPPRRALPARRPQGERPFGERPPAPAKLPLAAALAIAAAAAGAAGIFFALKGRSRGHKLGRAGGNREKFKGQCQPGQQGSSAWSEGRGSERVLLRETLAQAAESRLRGVDEGVEEPGQRVSQGETREQGQGHARAVALQQCAEPGPGPDDSSAKLAHSAPPEAPRGNAAERQGDGSEQSEQWLSEQWLSGDPKSRYSPQTSSSCDSNSHEQPVVADAGPGPGALSAVPAEDMPPGPDLRGAPLTPYGEALQMAKRVDILQAQAQELLSEIDYKDGAPAEEVLVDWELKRRDLLQALAVAECQLEAIEYTESVGPVRREQRTRLQQLHKTVSMASGPF